MTQTSVKHSHGNIEKEGEYIEWELKEVYAQSMILRVSDQIR